MGEPSSAKTSTGNFFEDFSLDQEIRHAVPRTVTEGDVSLYTALYGSRFAIHTSNSFAQSIGLERAPVDDLLVFHLVFGKTVPDISLNAVANLGYAGGRFGVPVNPGDTLRAVSRVVGLKENSNRKTGVVYVHSRGLNQHDETVVEYYRWVMVRKRDPEAVAAEALVPDLPDSLAAGEFMVPKGLTLSGFDAGLAGGAHFFEDYRVGERIDHIDGVTIEEAEHQMATRLYHNTARVHFDQHMAEQGRFGRRLVYGGHVISAARALTFNGLANGIGLAAINGGSHVNPTFAGDTIYAWSEVLDCMDVPGHDQLGALRLRLVAVKNRTVERFPLKTADGKYDPDVVLDFDHTLYIPKYRHG